MRNSTQELFDDIRACCFYPAVVVHTLDGALGDELVRAGVVLPETTFDTDRVRRHLTVVAITATRLVVVHVDDGEESVQASSESVPLRRIGTIAVTRNIVDAAGPIPRTTELTIAVEWGSVRRMDLQPATCDDPNCPAEHGLTGSATPDDIALRFTIDVEGAQGLKAAEEFAKTLQSAAAQAVN